jgi:serine/threonine-protein kinase
MKVALTVTGGAQHGRVFEFTEPCGLTIGRARDATVCIPDDPYVSRRHVYLEITPPRCRLRDLASTNPPHVNGKPVVEYELADGDLVEVGYTRLRVAIDVAALDVVGCCAGCGRPVVLVVGEQPPATCPACAPSALRDCNRGTPRATCAFCHADLSANADLDGRATDLEPVAFYACDAHVGAERGDDGLRIGPYQVRRVLGEGAMGVVYLGYHPRTARVWAVKQVRDLACDALVKRFEREVQLMQRIVHSHVVRCVDTGIDGQGLPYLVSEYMPDGSLEALVQQRGGQLPIEEAVRLAKGILAGLEHLHEHGIIHRDVKPLNILLRGGVPKLADFGIAKSYARAGGAWHTRPGTPLGTLMFIPPEQITDAGNVREPADLYAAGVTLYYLLTGRYSFDFPGPMEAAALHREQAGTWKNVEAALQALVRYRRVKHPFFVILEEEPIPVRERDASIPAGLAAVVDRAVRKDARARFQSAAEFRHALDPTT